MQGIMNIFRIRVYAVILYKPESLFYRNQSIYYKLLIAITVKRILPLAGFATIGRPQYYSS